MRMRRQIRKRIVVIATTSHERPNVVPDEMRPCYRKVEHITEYGRRVAGVMRAVRYYQMSKEQYQKKID